MSRSRWLTCWMTPSLVISLFASWRAKAVINNVDEQLTDETIELEMDISGSTSTLAMSVGRKPNGRSEQQGLPWCV